MKKLLSLGLALTMTFSLAGSTFAMDQTSTDIKTVEIPLSQVLDNSTYALGSSRTMELFRDSATSYQVGTLKSTGQYVDFVGLIPDNASIQKVTIYCPSTTKVTTSGFVEINNYVIDDGKNKVSVQFQHTNNPSFRSETSAFNGKPNSTKWHVHLEGRSTLQPLGYSNFTVYGGKMIIEYR